MVITSDRVKVIDVTRHSANEWVPYAIAQAKGHDSVIISAESECPFELIVRTTLDALPNAVYIDGGSMSMCHRHISYPALLVGDMIHATPTPFEMRNTYFVCLNRVARSNRTYFVNELLQRNLQQYGVITLGSDPTCHDTQWIEQIMPQYRHMMPLTLDELTATTQYDLPAEVQDAIINVVTESSSDYQLAKYETWDRMFATEKTAKAFAMHQLPLFVTVPGYVEYLRSIGFDMFDDILDHSYDSEPVPTMRIQRVAAELDRLCKIPLAELQQFCSSNKERFAHNDTHRAIIVEQLKQEAYSKVNQLIQGLQ